MIIFVLDVSYFMGFVPHMSVTLAELMLDTTSMFLSKFAGTTVLEILYSGYPGYQLFATLVRIINTRIPAASHV